MKIDVLCSSADHPINPWIKRWIDGRQAEHDVTLLRKMNQLTGGDLLFLVSCAEMIPADMRNRYGSCVVLHASNLPKGRGWSPYIWSIIEGAQTITVSAIEAEDEVDSGAIWAKKSFEVAAHELYDEINESLFAVELDLMGQVIEMVERGLTPTPQPDSKATYYRRRTPADSELDPSQSISDLFNKVRVCDPNRYPAYFKLHGHVYSVCLKKVQRDE